MAKVVGRRGAGSLKDLIGLCKQRGLIFPSSEIYGGFANSFDYGPIGTLLKRKLVDSWWRRFVTRRNDVHGLDSAVMLPPSVWERSGHLENFTDPLVDCKSCKERFRADHIVEEFESHEDLSNKLKAMACPCGKIECWGEHVSDVRNFNLMFETSVGPVVGQGSAAYFRPETAQGAYINFANVCTTTNASLPFGIAQVGKAFRNEVTPGNYIFRTREFEQMELQWFCREKDSNQWFEFWLEEAQDWLFGTLKLNRDNVRLSEHAPEDLAHYAKRTVDIEFNYPFGWGELWGIANRGTFDLSRHELSFRDKTTKENFVPTIIEPALGLNRLLLAVLSDSYVVETLEQDNGKTTERTVLQIAPCVAPYSVAVLPLIGKNADQLEVSKEIFAQFAENPWFNPVSDTSNTSVGKRYRRQDEIGTPYCVTVDFDTSSDKCVTVRDRDSMKQVRVPIETITLLTLDGMASLFTSTS